MAVVSRRKDILRSAHKLLGLDTYIDEVGKKNLPLELNILKIEYGGLNILFYPPEYNVQMICGEDVLGKMLKLNMLPMKAHFPSYM